METACGTRLAGHGLRDNGTAMASASLDPLAYLGEQLAEWKKAGTYQRLRILEGPCAAESKFDGKEVINLASNNYLGLTTHPKLIEAAIEATRKYGAGSGAVRTISGTMDLHMELSVASRRSKMWRHAWSSNPDSRPTPARWRPC